VPSVPQCLLPARMACCSLEPHHPLAYSPSLHSCCLASLLLVSCCLGSHIPLSPGSLSPTRGYQGLHASLLCPTLPCLSPSSRPRTPSRRVHSVPSRPTPALSPLRASAAVTCCCQGHQGERFRATRRFSTLLLSLQRPIAAPSLVPSPLCADGGLPCLRRIGPVRDTCPAHR
jgi:hypothetical protein